jgi:membrane protease YdiL (CAAX protease family)
MKTYSLQTTIASLSQKLRRSIFLTGWAGLILFGIFLTVSFSLIASLRLSEADFQLFISSSLFLTYINFFTYFLIFSSLLALLRHHYIDIFTSFLSIEKFVKGFSYAFMVILINVLISLLYETFNLQPADNNNQSLITSLVLEAPILSFITFVFLGPIVEEFTYRLGLFSLLAEKNKYLAYVVTMFIFGFIHFDFSSLGTAGWMNELLNMPFYITAGLMFCFIYEKEDFAVVTYAHVFNNLISISSILFIGNAS